MSYVYRITKSPEVGELVDSIEAVKKFARQNGCGRYHVDEIGADPFRVVTLPGAGV
jgi:hypothetical protein